MKKKLSLLLCLVIMAFGLSACGTDPQDISYYGMGYADFENYAKQNVEALANMTDEEKAYFETIDDDVITNLVNTWNTAAEGIGSYQGLGDFTITKAQDTITLEQIAVMDERDICVTFVFKYNYTTEQLEPTAANADLVYSMGEKMAKAGMNTLMGMGTVFVVLILISLIIYCFRFISAAEKKAPENRAPEQKVPVAAAPPAIPEEDFTDDLELAAVIAAAVAASEGVPADAFVVRSIRRHRERNY